MQLVRAAAEPSRKRLAVAPVQHSGHAAFEELVHVGAVAAA